MTWKLHFKKLFNINMSSPSLPLVPQWLEILIGVNQAQGILLRLWENKAQMLSFENPLPVTSQEARLPPLSLTRPWESELRPCECISFFLQEKSWLANERSITVAQCFGCSLQMKTKVFLQFLHPSLWRTSVLILFSLEMRQHNFPKFCMSAPNISATTVSSTWANTKLALLTVWN